MIRVCIFEDNRALREALVLLFGGTDDLLVVGIYEHAMDVLEVVKKDQPDVILMDIEMPGRSGIEAVELVKRHIKLPKVIIMTIYEDAERILAAIRAGAVGYVLKQTPSERILEAVRQVADGGAVMTPSIAMKILSTLSQPIETSPEKHFSLTPKENEVLKRLVQGDSYKLISDHCGMSMGTVRTHIVNIYEKMHVNSKSEAVAKILRGDFLRENSLK